MVKTSGIDLLGFLLVCTSIWGSIIFSAAAADEDLETRCTNMIVSVEVCLDFASGKAESPSKGCCDASAALRKKDPLCLCYLIQQVHGGNPGLKDFGLKVDKIIALGPICDIKNSSMSSCPKYLNILPGTPDYAFFTNSSTKAPSSAPAAMNSSPTNSSPTNSSPPAATTSPPKRSNISDGIMPRPDIGAAIAIIAFVTGFMSMIHT